MSGRNLRIRGVGGVQRIRSVPRCGVCDPQTGTCSNPVADDGTPCDDGNACTQTDTWPRVSASAATRSSARPRTSVTTRAFRDPETGACSNPAKPDGTLCDDGDRRTQTDTCQLGVCVGGNSVICAAFSTSVMWGWHL
ncbi:MAG: hypothetical protein U0031_20650 [Thermomicrobiales bacterium]